MQLKNKKNKKNKLPGPDCLSVKQTEVLALYAACFSLTQMADKLNMSEKTVDTHMTRIREKLNTKFTKILIPYAYHHNLITPEQVMNLYYNNEI